MPGPAPKHPSTRARRNKTTSARTLHAVPSSEVIVPELPALRNEAGRKIQWHPQTLDWWADVWSSPMAPEYDDSDRHGLFLLARLVDASWRTPSPSGLKDLLGEIRLQRQCFGLTPIDRRRLQWEIERTDEAQAKGAQRRAATKGGRKKKESDPRSVLHAV